MPDMLFGGARKAQQQAAKSNERRQLAELARQKAQAEQAGSTGGQRRAGALLNFANPQATLSGDGQSTFG